MRLLVDFEKTDKKSPIFCYTLNRDFYAFYYSLSLFYYKIL